MLLNIVHLPHRRDRYESLMTELEFQGIRDYKIWEGVIDETIVSRGIALAHKQIVRDAQNNNLSCVAIAEDDIHFTSKDSYAFFLNNIPLDYDLYLGGITWRKKNSGDIVEDFAGTVLYIIHQRFYKTFLSLPESLNFDRALKGCGKFVVVDPMIAMQHNGYSDNQKRHMDYDAYNKRFKFLI